MVRVRAVVLDGPASAEQIAAIRAELAGQPDQLVVAPPTIADLIRRVAFETGVGLVRIIGASKDAPSVRARLAVYWLARHLTAASSTVIGRSLGGRDHSTVLSGIRRAEAMRQDDPAFARLTDRLREELGVLP